MMRGVAVVSAGLSLSVIGFVMIALMKPISYVKIA